MIDGLGGNQFADLRPQLPWLNSIASRGSYVPRLAPERCATSFPGRASIITGVPSSEHGVYGNVIWDGQQFRYANSGDVMAPSVVKQAKDAGLKVANIGYGMSPPKDCDYYYPSVWSHEMMQSHLNENDSNTPTKADQVWLREIALAAEANWMSKLDDQSSGFAHRHYDNLPEYFASGQLNDQRCVDWLAQLLCSQLPIDFGLVEISMPDYYLHHYGCEHDLTQQAIITADAQLGRLIKKLGDQQFLPHTNLIVTSDHGFTNIKYSIHPENIINDKNRQWQFSCEGAILFVHCDVEQDTATLESKLSAHQVKTIDNRFLPKHLRNEIACFLAPEEHDFYRDKYATGQAVGPSIYRATHGFAQGHQLDERFMLMAGPDIAKPNTGEHETQSRTATAEQVAPTISSLLGLDTSLYPAKPLV